MPFAFLAPTPRRFDEPADVALLSQLADSFAPALRSVFLDAVANLGAGVVVGQLTDALRSGDWTRAEAVIPFDRFEADLLNGAGRVIRDTLQRAGAATAADLAGQVGTVTMRFDLTNPAAVDWIDQNAAALVREVSDETRLAIRDLVRESFVQGVAPRDLARRIQQEIGLTLRGERAVGHYRSWLESLRGRDLSALADSSWERLARGGLRPQQDAKLIREGMTPARVDGLVSGYRDRLLRERATTIARTETMSASNAGQRFAWEQARAKGLFGASPPYKTWHTAADERTCRICLPLNGKRLPFDALFATAAGPAWGPILHPRCRCVLSLGFGTR